jgi:hypothetical protein
VRALLKDVWVQVLSAVVGTALLILTVVALIRL